MGTDQSSSKLGEARLLKKAAQIENLVKRPLLRLPNPFKIKDETFEGESRNPDYDPEVQLKFDVGERILFKSENDDMKRGYEIEIGTILEVNMEQGYILIKWDADDPNKRWIKKCKLPLTQDFSLV